MVSCGFAKHNGNTTKVYCQNSFSQEHTKVAGDQKQRVRRDLAGSESLFNIPELCQYIKEKSMP